MSAPRLLAIDVGTQSARAIVFDAQGTLIAKAQKVFEPTYHAPQPGWAEQDPEVYWQAVVETVRALWQSGEVRPEDISGLALTTQRCTVICLDEAGRILHPAIVWLDQRRCSQPPSMGPYALLPKLPVVGGLIRMFQAEAEANWLAQHRPQIWGQTRKFLFLSGFLTHRLIGEYVDSVGCQVGYVPFDYRRLAWAKPGDYKWRAVAVQPEQLPRLVAPGGALGRLSPRAATELGLPTGIPMIAAAADKACEVLGCGVLEPDVAQLSFGTTATINTTQPHYVEVQPLLPAYPAALPGSYNTEIQIYRGFWMVSWFKREFAHREQDLAQARGVPVEALFDDLVKGVPPGSMGLTLQPYWSPGVRDPGPEAKGAIIGFGDVHTRAHFYRAILEGLVYGLRAGREQIEKRIRRPLTRLRVAGGGSQSEVAMQITADVFALTAERPKVYETSALGAAINLAVGLGIHPDYTSAVQAMTRVGTSFTPDPAAAKTYDALYREVYRELYPRLKPLYQRIRRITGYPP